MTTKLYYCAKKKKRGWQLNVLITQKEKHAEAPHTVLMVTTMLVVMMSAEDGHVLKHVSMLTL